MDTALFVGMAHREALKRRMDVVAHNIANMSTTAFNKERVVFRQLLIDAPGADATKGGKISYVQDHGIVRNLDIGTPIPSNNPLDVFINGRGYLSVQGSDGETVYTRNGRMTIDIDRNLALLSGEKVLDENGQTIDFDDDDVNITIADDGTISTNNGEKGKITIVQFQNEQAMKRRGASLYETDQTPIEPENVTDVMIKSKAYESSNVNAVESMVEMIDVLRAYQKADKTSNDYQEMREDALRRLARVQ
ncbi:flagellar hook basal-body protein [Kordiimonas laminariae]|uniref:flagellar hook basal-body protein n=1 Tax=Kordiimonas laminariae TaxID=2917717 RepID=UPI001FF1B7A2|nr:flagellar hook basal-body protein [Kordiimonas laminariae]MCK0070468.1 flagellar hook basal-body protein [Kordiimonas laminariae]